MILDKEVDRKVEELRALESRLQNFLAQKQIVQVEINEIDNALEELRKTDDEVYKIVSGIMVRTNKDGLTKELTEKKKSLEIKVTLIEKQEKILEGNSASIKKEISDIARKNSKK